MDPTCKWIIGGLVFTVASMAGYIVKQHLTETKVLREWIKSLRESGSLLDLVDDANPK